MHSLSYRPGLVNADGFSNSDWPIVLLENNLNALLHFGEPGIKVATSMALQAL